MTPSPHHPSSAPESPYLTPYLYRCLSQRRRLMMGQIGSGRSLVDRRISRGVPPGEESPMLARDLFGPVAEQRVHDRNAEIERERRRDEMTSPAASATWQSTPPLTIREREAPRQVAVGRSDWHIVSITAVAYCYRFRRYRWTRIRAKHSKIQLSSGTARRFDICCN